MLGRFASLVAGAALAVVACGVALAQRTIWPVDFEHSIAAFSLDPANKTAAAIYPGVAKVAGFAKVDLDDPENSSFELNVYPSREESRVLNPDGTLRVDSYADLARYTLMMFQSKSVAVTPEGRLTLTGDLTASYVEREEVGAWSIAYTGPQLVNPHPRVHIRQVTFTLENNLSDLKNEQRAGFLRFSGWTVISREEFPELWTWLRDSVWPIVVEDEHCAMPPFYAGSTRDYKGVSCTGNLIENPLREPARGGRRSAHPTSVVLPRPPGDSITIFLRINIHEPR